MVYDLHELRVFRVKRSVFNAQFEQLLEGQTELLFHFLCVELIVDLEDAVAGQTDCLGDLVFELHCFCDHLHKDS